MPRACGFRAGQCLFSTSLEVWSARRLHTLPAAVQLAAFLAVFCSFKATRCTGRCLVCKYQHFSRKAAAVAYAWD